MADDETQAQDTAAEPDADAPSGDAAAPQGWRGLWQAPTLIIGGTLLAAGLFNAATNTTDPSMDPLLDQSDAMIRGERYEEAIELLNTKVYPWVALDEHPYDEDKIRYHVNKARAIGRGQQAAGFELDENHTSVVREYRRAEELGAELGDSDIAASARAHLALGDADEAIRRGEMIPYGAGGERLSLDKDIVERLLDRRTPDTERAERVLAGMLLNTELSPQDRVWALERSSGIRLDAGHVDETVTRILRAMPRLERAQVDGLSRLHLLLARAYTTLGAYEQARKQLGFAYELAGAADPHYARILYTHARVEDLEGNTEAARDLYERVTMNFSRHRVYPGALLGLGETEAALGETEVSLQAYGSLVDQYESLRIETEPSRDEITRSLHARAGDMLALGRPSRAIEYTELSEQLYTGEEIPTSVLEMYTRSHKAAAEDILGQPVERTGSLLMLDPSTRAEVQRHLLIAAANARLHAQRFVVSDIDQHASSLWEAAGLFDVAGDHREAIVAFQTYADTMPSDVRYAEALFRLAEALRSTGELAKASEIYQRLLEERRGVQGADIGRFADESMVPLAQAYLYDEEPGNDAKAESLLVRVLDGTREADTGMYRRALLELAGYYDANAQAERAIERYEEFVARYAGDPETAGVIYKLADAHRRLADRIEATLGEPMPATERSARVAKVRAHREEAIEGYERAIGVLSELGVHEAGIFETTALRNAYFYLGACAYDLGRYEEAIRFYDIARDRYSSDPASLIAMIQIVNAYIERGELGRAKTANERARRFYANLPPEVWDDPDLPMDRADWERWLDSSSTLITQAPGAEP